MVELRDQAPGVYIEEITPAGPIAGAGTSTAALIGHRSPPLANSGRSAIPVRSTNWTQLRRPVRRLHDRVAAAVRRARVLRERRHPRLHRAGQGRRTAWHGAARPAHPGALDVSLVCAPGLVDAGAQARSWRTARRWANRFAVLDGAQDTTPLKADGPLQTQRGALLSEGGYGALYWPWIVRRRPAAAAGKPADDDRAAVRPRRRDHGPQRRAGRRAQGAGERGRQRRAGP